METRANHILVGSFVIVVVLLLLGSLLWLGKFGDERDVARFDIVFSESVIGLSKGSMVSYNGVPVGEVETLRVDPKNLARVLVRVRITGRELVRADTEATLGFAPVTGVADIRLSGGSLDQPVLWHADRIATIHASLSPLAALTASGKDIMSNINEAATRLGDLLSEQNIAHVHAVLGNVDRVTAALAREDQSIEQALRQLSEATGQLQGTLAGIEAAAQSVQTLMQGDARELLASSNATAKRLDALALQLETLVAENRSALSGFANQGLRQAGPTLDELRATLADLQQLASRWSRSDGVLVGSPQPREFRPR